MAAPAKNVARQHDCDELLGLIAHDLRAPLSMIAACMSTLQRCAPTLPTDVQRTLSIMEHSTHVLDVLIRELVDATRFESAVTLERVRRTPLARFVTDVLDRMLDIPERDRVRIEAAAAPVVDIDQDKIERVVVNLVRNALAHAPGSPITILVGTEDDRAIVTVIDRGPGIAAAALPTLFEKHPKPIAGSARAGLGLGLYISRLLVEAHGGTIGVASRPGTGSTFWFRIPLAAGLEQPTTRFARGTNVGPAVRSHLAGCRVLAVDDEPSQLDALAELLRFEGLVVETATTGAEALRLSHTWCPDVVLLDVVMVGLSGSDLVEHLRDVRPGMPVILVSGLPSTNPRVQRILERPGLAHVVKPIEMDSLLAAISGLLRG